MSLTKIKSDESVKLEFAVSIFGTNSKPESRFIIEGKDFSLDFPCKQNSSGKLEVHLPKLGKILESGEHKIKLEMIIDEKIYTPIKDTIEIESPIKVTAESISAKIEEPKIISEEKFLKKVTINVEKQNTKPQKSKKKVFPKL